MSENAIKFEQSLKSKGIELEKRVDDYGTTFIVVEIIEGVGPISVGVIFNDNDTIVNIVAYKYLFFDNSEKRQLLLELINTLNIEYTFCKFTEKDNYVTLQISAPFQENFSSDLLTELVFYVYKAIKDEHHRFMEILGK